ncbi:unnamed protein product, partial [Sphagnum troendelagicum]
RTRPKLKKNRHIVYMVHQVCSQKYKTMLSKNYFHICSLKPNLAKSSSGELPLWITQKNCQKKTLLSSHEYRRTFKKIYLDVEI